MTKEEASKMISEKIQIAYDAIKEAEELADEYGLEMSFNPAYGMGGWYYGKNSEAWDSDDAADDGNAERGYWMASSRSC